MQVRMIVALVGAVGCGGSEGDGTPAADGGTTSIGSAGSGGEPTAAETEPSAPPDSTGVDSTGPGEASSSGTPGDCVPNEPEVPQGFHVAPQGSPAGDGSEGAPWDLATALAQPEGLAPGATLYLREGVYAGHFRSDLVGTSDAPVVVRSYPGEWAVIDGALGETQTTFEIHGEYAVFRDFEITDTDPERFGGRPNGLYVYGPGVEVVNLVIHDGGGNGFWNSAVDAVLYGNLIYHNGYDDDDRPHGHAIYTQNTDGTKEIAHNILFGNYSFGVHAYTEGGSLVGFDFVDNIWFGASMAADGTGDIKDNFLIGGTQSPAGRVYVARNIGYAPTADHRSVRFGYNVANDDITVEDNDLAGRTDFSTAWSTMTIRGNRFYGDVVGIDPTQYADNEYAPVVAEPAVFVRPNRYQSGRANIAVYNPGLDAEVDVDLAVAIEVRSHFVVRNAQDYFGAPVAEGVYDGGTVHLPLEGLSAVQPIGNAGGVDPTQQTGPAFQVFIVESTPCAEG